MDNIKDNLVGELTPPVTQAELNVSQPVRTGSKAVTVTVVLYLLLVIGAEFVAIFIGVLPAAIIDGVLLVALANLSYFTESPEIRHVFIALTLVPLLRILSLAMAVPQITPIFWYVMIGLPLLVASAIVVRINGLTSLSHNLSWGKWVLQVVFGLTGIPIGLLASSILPPPAAIIPNPSWVWVISGAIVLTLFSGVTEEIIFRGLVQKAFSYTLGLLGFIISSILYECMFLGTLQPGTIIFFGLIGILFAIWVQITDSLWGVILAHSIVNIIFLLLIHVI